MGSSFYFHNSTEATGGMGGRIYFSEAAKAGHQSKDDPSIFLF